MTELVPNQELINSLSPDEREWVENAHRNLQAEPHNYYLINLLTNPVIPGLRKEKRDKLFVSELKVAVQFAIALSRRKIINISTIFEVIMTEIGMNHRAKKLKRGLLLPNLLIILLNYLLRDNSKHIGLKYPDMDTFLDTYREEDHEDFSLEYCSSTSSKKHKEEYLKLWCFANAAAILFQIIAGQCNFTLAMEVLPKVTEGWRKVYTTGGGKISPWVKNRDHIVRTEGEIPPKRHRDRKTKVVYEQQRDVKNVKEEWAKQEVLVGASYIHADSGLFVKHEPSSVPAQVSVSALPAVAPVMTEQKIKEDEEEDEEDPVSLDMAALVALGRMASETSDSVLSFGQEYDKPKYLAVDSTSKDAYMKNLFEVPGPVLSQELMTLNVQREQMMAHPSRVPAAVQSVSGAYRSATEPQAEDMRPIKKVRV